MHSGEFYIGCKCGVEEIRALNEKLNMEVVEQVNNAQELVMLNNFARECNECLIKKSLRERISDIESWRWVLEDLSGRLNEAIPTLQYEHNALRVVVERVQKEIDERCAEGSRPGACCPMSDAVEEAIMQEYNFLLDQKSKFENMIPEIDNEIKSVSKIKKRIDLDLLDKQKALSVEQSCAKINVSSPCRREKINRSKKRATPITRWQNRCESLKQAGLKALSNAAVTRQQVRGARVHLSIAAQAYAARVDSALRRRLHTNRVKLQDLKWQKEEALKDYKSLEEELTNTEQNLLETMEQERVIESRLSDRSFRPPGELTKDDVDRKIRDELGRIRNFTKQLRTNLDRIILLQNNLADSMARTDCYAEDLLQIVSLDEERIQARLGEVPNCDSRSARVCHPNPPKPPVCAQTSSAPSRNISTKGYMTAIREEDETEVDDYPFDH